MEISCQTLSQSRIKCVIKFSAEEKAKAEQQALSVLGQRVNLKGFRPGKAPPDMVRASVNADDMLTETARVLLPDAIRQSLEQSKAQPILPPQVGVESRDPLTISILFIGKPEVTLRKPEKIKADKGEPTKIEQKDIDEFLQRALANHRVETVIDRPAQHGDVVYISSEAADAEGNPLKEISHPSVRLTVGSADDFVPGIGEHLQGMKTNDSKAIDAVFPSSHGVPALRDKKAKIKIAVKSVASVTMPEITAEFLETKLKLKRTPDEFKADVEKMLGDQKAGESRRKREEAFFDAIRAATTVDLAPELAEAEVQEMLRDLQERLQRENLTMDDWIKAMGKEPKEILETMRVNATKQLTLRLGLEAMLDWKKIAPDETKFKQIVADSKQSAARQGNIRSGDFEPGGNAYRQIEWDLRMRTLMDEYVG